MTLSFADGPFCAVIPAQAGIQLFVWKHTSESKMDPGLRREDDMNSVAIAPSSPNRATVGWISAAHPPAPSSPMRAARNLLENSVDALRLSTLPRAGFDRGALAR